MADWFIDVFNLHKIAVLTTGTRECFIFGFHFVQLAMTRLLDEGMMRELHNQLISNLCLSKSFKGQRF